LKIGSYLPKLFHVINTVTRQQFIVDDTKMRAIIESSTVTK